MAANAKLKQQLTSRPEGAPSDNADPDELISVLERMARDPDAPAHARTAAARAVLEARGVLGKHQQAPDGDTAHVPLSQASRAELEQELVRLRRRFAAEASP